MIGEIPPDHSDKQALRMDAKAIRRALGDAYRMQSSSRIRQRLADEARLMSARCVAFYSPIQTEVDVGPLMESFLSRTGVTVLLPCTDLHVREVSMRQVKSLDELEEGPFRILQPGREIPRFDIKEIDAILVPALFYDLKGYRLGYGSGFYDRLLSRLSPDALKIGVQYDALVRDTLPVAPFDVPVHLVMTEARCIEVT